MVAWPPSKTTVLPASSAWCSSSRGVGDHGPQALGVAEQVVDDLVDGDRAAVVDLHEQVVLLVAARLRPSGAGCSRRRGPGCGCRRRLILSAYAGPMPRPVVPIWRLPRKRSVTLSSVRWYCVMTCALALTTQLRDIDVRGSRARRARRRAPRCRRRRRWRSPGTTPAVRMPDGSRCSAYFWSPIDHGVTGVVAAVELDDVVDAAASRSVALPLPSSPHWAPTITIAGIGQLRR